MLRSRIFPTVDGTGAGAFGAGKYSGVTRNVAGSGPFDKSSSICSEIWFRAGGKGSRDGSCILTDEDCLGCCWLLMLQAGSEQCTPRSTDHRFLPGKCLDDSPDWLAPAFPG